MYSENDLKELEQYFKTVKLPKEIQLSQSEKVTDVPKFINNTLASCRSNQGVKAFEAAYDRLLKLKGLLK